MNIPIIIVAAGASQRLGRPKQLELVNGSSLLYNTVSSALKSAVGHDVIVILGANKDEVILGVDILNKCNVIFNPNWKEGMGSSIALAIKQLKMDQHPAAIISVCDQPFISSDIFSQIANLYDGKSNSILVSKYKNGNGPPSLFGNDYYEQLKALKKDEGGKNIIKENIQHVIFSPFNKGDIDIDIQKDIDLIKD